MKSVAVIGSSGAIGSAFISSYLEDETIENIISFSRSLAAIFSICVTKSLFVSGAAQSHGSLAVSYTHLTLPTSDLV